MLDDRPEMKRVFDEEHPLVEWMASSFAGSGLESRVYWNAEEPASGFLAEHSCRYSVYPAQVRVVAGDRLSGLDKWIAITFEMHNLRDTDEFSRLNRAAYFGRVTKEQFVAECVDLELDAAVETAEFLEKKLTGEVLKRSKVFRMCQAVVKSRKEGKKYQTELVHYAYYEAAYDRMKSSNPQNEANR